MGFAFAGAAIGGIIAAHGAQSAADTQADAVNSANQAAQNQNNQNRTDTAPARAAGDAALGEINSQMGDYNQDFSMADFQSDPGYQFRLAEGQKAIDRSASAKGILNSTATMKSLSDYNQGQATQDYQQAYTNYNNDKTQRFNRLASVAGLGQQATLATAADGTSTANTIGNNTVSAGNAQAASGIAQGNAINNAIGTGMNSWYQQQLLSKLGPNGVNPNNSVGYNAYGTNQTVLPADNNNYEIIG